MAKRKATQLPTKDTPALKRHRASNRAYVIVDGRRIYLGPWRNADPEPETLSRYYRFLAELSINSGRMLPDAGDDGLTVAEVAAAFYEWAREVYSHSEAERCRVSVKGCSDLYGCEPAATFGPKALSLVREQWIREGHSRNGINARVKCVRRCFRWAAERELVPGSVVHGLDCLAPLRRGRTAARETEPVRPVAVATIEKTLPHLNHVVAVMVEFQRLTGCRPGEVCGLRPRDIDTSGEIWIARPDQHKGAWIGRERLIYIGPKCQKILRPYMLRAGDAYLFSPREAEAARHAAAETHRRPNQAPNPKKTDREVGECYSTRTYGIAIQRACKAAGVEHWAPNQLRHTRATEIRKTYGLEAAQLILGHASADVTQIYAETDTARAVALMKTIG